MTERLVHEASGVVLADRVLWARRWYERARGLIGRAELRPGEALVIDSAAQVHTFFVRYPIDVVFCDGDWNVLQVVSPIARRRVSRWVRGSRFVVELRAGSAAAVQPGDRLTIGT